MRPSKLKNPLSIRSSLIIAISLILVAGFLTTNIISYQVSKHSLRQTLIDNELPLTSNNIYSEIQRDLLRPVLVATTMSNDAFVKDWLNSGEKDPRKMIRYLEEIRRKFGVFTSFLVSDATRRYYHFSGITQTISEKDSADAWYFRVRSMKKNHEINVDLNPEQNNVLTIFVNKKVYNFDGQFLAATGVGLKFGKVAEIVDRYKKNFGRNVYFVDDAGKVMVRSDGAMIIEDNILSAPGIADVAKDIIASDHGFF